MQVLSSSQNKIIKELIALSEKSKLRKQKGLFVLEGKREFEIAMKSGYDLHTAFVQPELLDESSIFKKLENHSSFEVTTELYAKIAYRESTEGIICIFKQKDHELSKYQLPNTSPLFLVLESIEKPGNLGAIFRSADAANMDAVIITESIVDLYNPNCLRSSLGCALSIPSIVCNNEDLQIFFEENNIRSYAATLQNSNNYLEENYTGATAFIVGSEAKGLKAFWRENAAQNIVIPMRGTIDSMNVSVAASILLFEAIRQRSSL